MPNGGSSPGEGPPRGATGALPGPAASGRQQAEQLGKLFRTALYPSNLRGGLLRLHSTYRSSPRLFYEFRGGGGGPCGDRWRLSWAER